MIWYKVCACNKNITVRVLCTKIEKFLFLCRINLLKIHVCWIVRDCYRDTVFNKWQNVSVLQILTWLFVWWITVFLGGSCNPTKWRAEIAIPYFKQHGITFYNPVRYVHTLTIYTYNIHLQYTLTIHTYNIRLQYTLTIHTYNIHLQYTLTIYAYNTHLQYTLTIYAYNTHLQYTLTIHTYNTHLQYTLTIYTYNTHLQYTLTIYTYNTHLQYTLTIYTYNIHLQYTLKLIPNQS